MLKHFQKQSTKVLEISYLKYMYLKKEESHITKWLSLGGKIFILYVCIFEVTIDFTIKTIKFIKNGRKQEI